MKEQREIRNRQGEMAEMMFVSEAIRRGFIVSRPIFDKNGYDFIVDTGSGLSRIQVKSTAKKQGRSQNYIFSLVRGHKKVIYTDKEFNYLAAYIKENDSWYIIPREKLGNLTKLVISSSDKSVIHRKFDENFEKYRENW